MSSDKTEVQHTQHAFLVAWGCFAEHIGLIWHIQAVSLKQKRCHHTPQSPGIPGRHSGRAEAFAGHQPFRPSAVIASAMPTNVSEAQTYRFKVSYRGAEDVWFIIETSAQHTLDDLHRAIIEAADFDDDHQPPRERAPHLLQQYGKMPPQYPGWGEEDETCPL